MVKADGQTAGFTYPKRAKGLVKKGRAHYVNDFEICLDVSDENIFLEEHTMETIKDITTSTESTTTQQPVTHLCFNAREWSFNKDCSNNKGIRTFIQGPDGLVAEAYMIGDWGWNWTEIQSKTLILEKNMLHTFTFWLNGGENDNNNEICRFEVIFNNDYENRYTFNLNRNFIRPLKKVNGWELYEIPFLTGDNEYTQLRFVAQRAYMTVLAAKDPAAYAALPDTVDEFEGERPQRHNIVFDDGYPTDEWYSTKNLRAEREKKQAQQDNPNQNFERRDGNISKAQEFGGNAAFAQMVQHVFDDMRASLDPIALADEIREIADDAIDEDEIFDILTSAIESAISGAEASITQIKENDDM